MTIKLVLPEEEPGFIRHARTETLKSLHESPTQAAIAPAPFAFYVMAFAAPSDTPIALAEFTMFDQVYKSFVESPYPASMDLARFCPMDQMAGVRTIYLEPEYRQTTGSLYLQLVATGCQIAQRLGARFSMATTNSENDYLNRLYAKTGGRPFAPIHMEGLAEIEIAPWIFNIRELLNHRLVRRAHANAAIDIDFERAWKIRSRTAWDEHCHCA